VRGEPRASTLGHVIENLPDLLPSGHPRALWLRILFGAGAVVCLALGVIGWLIPLVTGIPFYLAALGLLAAASDRARQVINALEARLPHHRRLALRRWLRRSPRLCRLMRVPAESTEG